MNQQAYRSTIEYQFYLKTSYNSVLIIMIICTKMHGHIFFTNGPDATILYFYAIWGLLPQDCLSLGWIIFLTFLSQ